MNENKPPFVLNTRNTLYISLAFFSILMFWQIYNLYGTYFIDQLLGQRFPDRFPEPADRAYVVGIIMALDNFFALFMLPIFGVLSDKTKSRFGRRMPYIILGMFAAAIVFPFIAIAYIANSLFGVVILMLMVLVIMNIYRNPAIALMPDITPKPLRSKANGIINLIGYIGAILASVFFFIFGVDGGMLPGIFGEQIRSEWFSLVPFLLVSGIMLVAMIVLFIKIKENKLVEESMEQMAAGEAYSLTMDSVEEGKPLSALDKRNMFFLLLSVFLWFAAFNAIETFISVYSDQIFGSEHWAGIITAVLVVFSILTFIPAALIAQRIGRKLTILFGLIALVSGLVLAFIVNDINLFLFVGIAISGIGWALINVNSYPMMVELAHKNNVGRYTGYYYTSSMLAQSFTPIVAGLVILVNETYNILFPYSIVLGFAALVSFAFVKENKDSIEKIKTGFETFDVD